jgi:heme-degrading monooxygenase HmoA
MATMIVRHKVADFTNWKQIFDSMNDVRRSHGWISHEVLRDANDPNMVTIVNRAKTIDGITAYGQSQELKEGMRRAGVVSEPVIIFSTDEDHLSY